MKQTPLDSEVLKRCLPYMTGQIAIENVDPKDTTLVNHLECLGGGCGYDHKSGELKFYRSENMLKFPFGDRSKDKEKFYELDFEFDIDVTETFTVNVLKNAYDKYALVTSVDGTTIAAIKFIQDTRNPWVDLEGDPRPWEMSVVVKDEPMLGTGSPMFPFWRRTPNQDGTKGIVSTSGNMRPYHLNIIIDKINELYFNKMTQTVVKRHMFNSREIHNFISSTTTSVRDNAIEVVKQAGSRDGEVYVSEIKVGTVSIRNINVSNALLDFNLEKQALEDANVTKTDVYGSVQDMFMIHSTAKKKFGGGKKQFRNTGIADAFQRSGK